MYIYKKIKNNKGFTLLEIIVSISLFTGIIITAGSIYMLSQQSFNKGSNIAELSQNARVSIDRLSREIRQSQNIITILPITNNDPINPPSNEIIFQDGHNVSEIIYIRYYLDNTNLMRSYTAYYFPSNPDLYVSWNSLDEFGNPPTSTVLEDRIVGEYFNSLEFWGPDGFINIAIELIKNKNSLNINTAVFSRN